MSKHQPNIYATFDKEEVLKNTFFSIRQRHLKEKTQFAKVEAPISIELVGHTDDRQHLKQDKTIKNGEGLPTKIIHTKDLEMYQPVLGVAPSVNEFLHNNMLSHEISTALFYYMKQAPWFGRSKVLAGEAKFKVENKPKVK